MHVDARRSEVKMGEIWTNLTWVMSLELGEKEISCTLAIFYYIFLYTNKYKEKTQTRKNNLK
jgi:hypothetical protein